MQFLNRIKEKTRLTRALTGPGGSLIVIYGRRRCGKSTLIREVLTEDDIYFIGQPIDDVVQRAELARVIAGKIPGFDQVIYPTWDALFARISELSHRPFTLCMDEFPYMVKSSPSLPGIIQKMIDLKQNFNFHIILCGSSQQMMHGLVLDSSSPLYGRATEIMKIAPMEAGWIEDALRCDAVQCITEYSVWGGVPRYWELRNGYASFEEAVKKNILDRYGVLHEEPARLFLDDMRESVQAFSILSVIGQGSNRISEVASRLNKPASQLSRPIENLIQLGYLRRDVPYGELEKNSKRGIYRIADPFMRFYFTYVVPNLSRLELNMTEQVYAGIEAEKQKYVSEEWENLCRRSVPTQPIGGISFDLARRWWGTNTQKEWMEIDVVAESLDKKYLLVGECKWSQKVKAEQQFNQLQKKASLLPFKKKSKVLPVLFLPAKTEESGLIVDAKEVITRLKI